MIVVITNIFLLCGAGYVLDWISYRFKGSMHPRGRLKRMVPKRLLHVYRRQVNAIKTRLKPGMSKTYQA